jgi:septum site-determining protein MinC
MDSSTALALDDTLVGEPNVPVGPAALLRGTSRGLEMVVDARAPLDAITVALEKRLGEAPAFFRGSDVRVTVDDGPLGAGYLARLDELAQRFALRIIEVTAARTVAAIAEAVPSKPNLAAGSAPNAFEEEEPTHAAGAALIQRLAEPSASDEPVMLADTELTELVEHDVPEAPEAFEEPTQTSIPRTLAPSPEAALPHEEGTRLFVGPVRSGVILDHVGHLIVFGDVNPGAEVRATGNIVVLGRLRGTAHAGIGQDVGFILALRLEPQQLRIGRKVARADSDTPASDAEIAYATGESIVVERYSGRLPRNLATSI